MRNQDWLAIMADNATRGQEQKDHRANAEHPNELTLVLTRGLYRGLCRDLGRRKRRAKNPMITGEAAHVRVPELWCRGSGRVLVPRFRSAHRRQVLGASSVPRRLRLASDVETRTEERAKFAVTP